MRARRRGEEEERERKGEKGANARLDQRKKRSMFFFSSQLPFSTRADTQSKKKFHPDLQKKKHNDRSFSTSGTTPSPCSSATSSASSSWCPSTPPRASSRCCSRSRRPTSTQSATATRCVVVFFSLSLFQLPLSLVFSRLKLTVPFSLHFSISPSLHYHHNHHHHHHQRHGSSTTSSRSAWPTSEGQAGSR